MARKDFHHPFQPYDIQQQFMEAMYECIEDKKVGIFESPTGTGKSLSLICSSLTWLREHKRKTFDEAVAAIEVDDDEPDWMANAARDARRQEIRQMRDDFEKRLQAVREREQKIREKAAKNESLAKRRKVAIDEPEGLHGCDDQFLLDDYDSDDEHAKDSKNGVLGYSAETTKLMEQLGMLQNRNNEQVQEETPEELKIFFCSPLPSDTSNPHGPDDTLEDLKQLSLGSRKNLCINPKVRKLGNQTAINERCIELQQGNTPKEQKCPFLPDKEKEDGLIDFRDHALAKVRDIEDLAVLGSKLGVCPYYASRPAIKPAEMVTLPYPLLLQKTARDALDISVKDQVVVIDEAHNLMDAIEGIHSGQISEAQLKLARESLIMYLQKFRNRLKGSNRVYVTQVVRVIDSILNFTNALSTETSQDGTLGPGQLLSGKGVDQINLAKLVRYISDSKLARKVQGYVASLAKADGGTSEKQKAAASTPDVPTLTHVQNFLVTLMNPSNEGRFFWSKEGGTTYIRYMLLDPSEHFREIVEDARAVVLAGGTMSPMEDYRKHLFPYLSSVNTFSCGHLIPPSNLLVRAVTADVDGPLEFSYKSRNTTSMERIGRALLALAPHVRGGLVVFFPSYGFLEAVLACWKQRSMIAKLESVMPLFSDDRGGSADATFKDYSEAASRGKGAILLSVIGGKLSEGINFSDDLGRCVVVVGLPFPNLQTAEWQARMQYIEEKSMAKGEPKGKASREHAENVCMRSVNQAIGRVIRHQNDWASVVLMDSRYSQPRIRSKLPGWMKESFPDNSASQVEGVVKDIGSFFHGKR
ncbi:hypothetical protein D0868_09976 [Hortaea werneckii]|uniref:ATP-dependent DNA helicase CHL1 n=1 Tax=Hortaea werneckii TaxID=91943 RepID=A0A3M6Y6H8_HORWE|nr:hypothetical protein D0868_09976 [Hortaea werneckii]